jgi:hypothetical protein
MKNFLFVTCLLFITGAQPFSKTDSSSSFKSLHSTECGSCSAPYQLTAVKNSNYLQLNWQGTVISYTYGGYYSYYDEHGNLATGHFSGTIGGKQKTITIPSSTFILTYRVISNCDDGSITESLPATFNF